MSEEAPAAAPTPIEFVKPLEVEIVPALGYSKRCSILGLCEPCGLRFEKSVSLFIAGSACPLCAGMVVGMTFDFQGPY